MNLEYAKKNESISIQRRKKARRVHRLRLSRLVSCGVNLRMVVRILTRFGCERQKIKASVRVVSSVGRRRKKHTLISLCSKN